jgi:glycosyltransferase involved in cell wall biosynthesis
MKVVCKERFQGLPDSDCPVFWYSIDENRSAVAGRLANTVAGDVEVLFLNGEPLEYEAAVTLRKRKGTRIVSVMAGQSPHYYHMAEKYDPVIDVHVSFTQAGAAKLKTHLGKTARVVVIPSGVALGKSPTARPSQPPTRIVYAGRLENRLKAIMRSVPFLTELVRLGADIRMGFFGDGPALSDLSAQLRRGGLSKFVTIFGRVPNQQVLEAYRSSHLSVLFSVTEGLSNSLLESMACGCVPVVMDMPGIREVVRDNVNGMIVTQGDVAAMAQRTASLAGTPERIEAMGAAARETIKRRFTIDRAARNYAELFEELAAMQPCGGEVSVPKPSGGRLDHPAIPNWLTVAIRKGLRSVRHAMHTHSHAQRFQSRRYG